MTQAALDRAVSAATGESLRTIRRRGFSIADPTEVAFDPEPSTPNSNPRGPLIVDWDELAAQRVSLFP
jgi:hypothetical protein